MKNVNLKTVLISLLEKWFIVLIVAAACTAVFGYNGYKSAKKDMSEDKKAEVEEYEKALAEYEDAIANVVKVKEEDQRQVEAQQKYVDKSVYMQLNADNISVVSLQYMITGDEEDFKAQDVIQGYVQYVNSGSFYRAVSGLLDSETLTGENLREVGSASAAENVFSLTVMLPDDDQAELVKEAAKKVIDSRKSVVEFAAGEFDIKLIEDSIIHQISADVLNRQMSNINNLKSYTNALADYETKEINTRSSRDSYIDKNKPDDIVVKSPKKEFVKGAVLGFVIGLALCFAVAFLLYLMSDRLKSYEDMLFAGIPVLLREKKDRFKKDADTFIDELGIMAAQRGVETSDVVIYPLTSSKRGESASQTLKTAFKLESVSSLKSACDKGNVILLVERGESRYGRIEEAVKLFEQLKTEVWGSIVLE